MAVLHKSQVDWRGIPERQLTPQQVQLGYLSDIGLADMPAIRGAFDAWSAAAPNAPRTSVPYSGPGPAWDWFPFYAQKRAEHPLAIDFKARFKDGQLQPKTVTDSTGRVRYVPWTKDELTDWYFQLIAPSAKEILGPKQDADQNAGRLYGAIGQEVDALLKKQDALQAQHGPYSPSSVLNLPAETQTNFLSAYDPTRASAREALKKGLGLAAALAVIGAGVGSTFSATGAPAAGAPTAGTSVGEALATQVPHLGTPGAIGTGAGAGAGAEVGAGVGTSVGEALATQVPHIGIPGAVGTTAIPGITVIAPAAGSGVGAAVGGAAGGAAGGIAGAGNIPGAPEIEEIVVETSPYEPPVFPPLPPVLPIPPQIPNPPPPDLPPIQEPGPLDQFANPENLLRLIAGMGSGDQTSVPDFSGFSGAQATTPRMAGLPYDPRRFNVGALLAKNALIPAETIASVGQLLSTAYPPGATQ